MRTYLIHQFEDKSLSQYSYAILSNGEVMLIDPSRDPRPYYDFARAHNATISGIIETHTHADFVSSHLEISNSTGATVYVSKFAHAEYIHTPFDDGHTIPLGGIHLRALNTPGHSPDSISIVLEKDGKDIAVFTGDTLFIGDCGRPDLREDNENKINAKTELAQDIYYSLRNKLMRLDDDVTIYPAHGAGTLCGKKLKKASSSTVGEEKSTNWSLQEMTEKDFVQELIDGQPFIPAYFTLDLEINKKGANAFLSGTSLVPRLENITCKNYDQELAKETVIIDTRPQHIFKEGHLLNSSNLQNGNKFETWLGSIIVPHEPFYLTAETAHELDELVERIARIGYEAQIKGIFTGMCGSIRDDPFNLPDFINNQGAYTIVDVRNTEEAEQIPIFAYSINIPLGELRDRISEIPLHKPIVVHCAGGYRSAAGGSIVKNNLKNSIVYDLGEAVSMF